MSVQFRISYGVDVMRGNKVVEHFDGPLAYKLACMAAAEKPGLYIRYYAKKA